MGNRAAIVVSHGQPSDPDVAEEEVAQLADAVAEFLDDWHVVGATLAGDQTLEAALETHRAADRLVIYPLFMSDGWFTTSVLPARIKKVLGLQTPPPVEQLPPLGVDPGLVELAAEAVDSAAADGPIELIVAGHGSGKSSRPAGITDAFAAAVGQRLGATRLSQPVRTGFVEQQPLLAEAMADAGTDAICLPFFAARRGHVLDDIPAAVTAAAFPGTVLDPIGCHPKVPRLIAQAIGSTDGTA
jgi:sirohydrochlorin ferrochelatase